MKRAVLLLGLLGLAPGVACNGASGTGSSARVVIAPKASARPAPAPIDALLGRTATEGLVVVRLSVARRHPLGPLIEPFVLAWPGWGATIASVTAQPETDVDWIAVVGPREPADERLMMRTTLADETVDARLASRSDGTLRVVERAQPHLVVALPPNTPPALLEGLRTAQVVEPEGDDPDEVLHVDIPEPHGVMLYVPPETRRAVVRAASRPGGAAEGFADLTFDDDATAAMIAAALRARAESMNNVMVRLLTRDLLGGVVITVEGAVVKIRLPATSDQLESLATLASARYVAHAGH